MGYIEDSFRDSLQTLDTTDAVPINTLTEIAQENQDTCAQAIAEILVEHIKSVSLREHVKINIWIASQD